MGSVSSVPAAFENFFEFLGREKLDHLEIFASLEHGFEKWLQLEFAAWAMDKYKLEAYEDIDLEYAVQLDRRRVGDKKQKQCDVWLRAPHEKYHFVELKVCWHGGAKKWPISCGDDLWFMSRLRFRYEKAASGSVVVLGMGFQEGESWEEVRSIIREEAELLEDHQLSRTGLIGDSISWDVWTHSY